MGNFSLNFSIPFSDIIFFIISTSLNQFSKSINTEKVETKGSSENLETASKVYAGEKTSVHEAAEKAVVKIAKQDIVEETIEKL